tara:strand:- start:648 stop:1274 length:627 start_codon:yes stop_codon:yes gene_type:complete
MPLRQDVVALARSCSRKRLLFVGDSSVQELMWELMLRTSCIVGRGSCVPINPLNLPVGSCANPHCLELSQKWIESSHTLSGNRAYTLANSSAKANFRCFSMNACSPDGKAVFAAAHLPFDADFVWSGNAGILQNGGGLQNSFGSAGWLRYFANVTRSTMRHSGVTCAYRLMRSSSHLACMMHITTDISRAPTQPLARRQCTGTPMRLQ